MDLYMENQWSNILIDISIMDLVYRQKLDDYKLSVFKGDSIYESTELYTEASIDNNTTSKNILIRIMNWFKTIFKKIGDTISNIFKKITSGDDNEEILVPKETEQNIKAIEKFQKSIQGLIAKVKQFDWAGALKILLTLAKPALKIAITVGAVILVKKAVVKRWTAFLDDSKKKLNDSIPDLSKAKDVVGNQITKCIAPIKDAATAVNDVTQSIAETAGKSIDDFKDGVEKVKTGYTELGKSLVGENNPRLINNLLKDAKGHKLSNGGGYAYKDGKWLFRKNGNSHWNIIDKPSTIISNLSSANEIRDFDKFVSNNAPDFKSWAKKKIDGYIKKKFGS